MADRWVRSVEHREVQYEIRGRDCVIYLIARQPYCDRGNWLAQVHPDNGTTLARDLDYQDGWPRYYFDLDRAKLECEAWLKKRQQWIDASFEGALTASEA